MGMFDEVRCEVPLPDDELREGVWFQTKSFPCPSLSRFVISNGGRLLDLEGNDYEPDGYIVMYTFDDDSAANPDDEAARVWREYQVRFVAGQLQGIERVSHSAPLERHVGLASFRWFTCRRASD